MEAEMSVANAVAAAICAFLATPHSAASPAEPWRIDPAHSKITFTVTKWGFVEVEGRFHDFDGTILYDRDAPERSRVQWRVKVASVDTGEPRRDGALQEREYFDASRCPEISFVSSGVSAVSSDRLEVTGTITIRGTSKALTIEVAYGGRHDVPDLGPIEMFQTTFPVDRLDFGLVGGSVLGPVISREAKITVIAAARPPH
jgi:polyisoprenoid-binding protein YceI